MRVKMALILIFLHAPIQLKGKENIHARPPKIEVKPRVGTGCLNICYEGLMLLAMKHAHECNCGKGTGEHNEQNNLTYAWRIAATVAARLDQPCGYAFSFPYPHGVQVQWYSLLPA